MMRKRLFVMGIIVFLFGVFFSNNALALNDSSSVYQKAWYAGVRTCYRATVSDGGLMSSVKLGEWDGAAANLFKEAGSDKRGKETVTVHTEGIVPIVAESNYKMACVVLLTERTAYKLPKGVVSSMEKKEEILSKIEYTRGVDGNDGADGDKCFSYKYIKSTKTSLTDYSDVEHFTPNLCIKKDDSGKYTAFVQELAGQYDTRINNDASNEVIQFIINGQNSLKVKIRIGNINRDLYQNYKEKDYLLSNYGSEAEIFSDIGNFITSSIGSVRNANDPILWDKQTVMGVNDATGEAESVTYTSYYYGACANYTPFTNGNGIECTSNNVYNGVFSDSTDNEVVYRKPSMRNSSDDSKVIEAFSNGAYDYEKIKFTDDEIYELYYYYLTEKYGATDIQCYSSEQYNAGEYQARLWTGSEYSRYCYFNVPKKNKDMRVWGVYDKSDTPALLFGKAIGIEELISQLNGLSNDSKPGTFNPSGSSSTNKNTGDTECYDGSGPVGWLVCPLVKMISGIGESLWEYVKDSFMVIPTDFFSENGGVRAAWDAIRNIANIVFIILFMVVIFSQLTGVGIDNYGVKKILPKLIVVAVLVNVSWIICELVADISNIVGSGIENMLTGFAQNISPASPESDTGKIIAGSIGDVVLAGGAGYLFALLSGPGLIGAAALGFAVLGIVITLVIGVLTMYLILIIREAGIILMIVLAPVAIVCYALPNTEKYFKKWYELSKALIVVFPLCGAAIGAGRLASAVLASIAGGDASVAAVLGAINSGNIAEYTTRVFAAASANPGLMVAAIVVQVLPFFFIPKLLKNSLSLMGNIGAKLSSSGRRFSGGLTRKIQGRVGSIETAKRLQQFEQNRASERWANRTVRRLGDRANLNERQRERLASANNLIAEADKRRKQNERQAGQNYLAGAMNENTVEARKGILDDDRRAGEEWVNAVMVDQDLEAGKNELEDRIKNTVDYRNAERNNQLLADRAKRLENQRRAGGNFFMRTATEQDLAGSKNRLEDEFRSRGAFRTGMEYKQGMELRTEEAAIDRLNDPTVRQAEEVSLKEKASGQKETAYGALLTSGEAKYTDELGNERAVNTNDVESLGRYHEQALVKYQTASDDQKDEIMAQIKAAQNILSRTDKGRTRVSSNFKNSIQSGNTAALSGGAAAHIISNYGDKYKAVDRGSHAMIMDLATKDLSEPGEINEIRSRLDTIDDSGHVTGLGGYSLGGVSKYTTETLVNADEAVLRTYGDAVENGAFDLGDDNQRKAFETLQKNAYAVREQVKAGTLKAKPETLEQIDRIIGGYTPSLDIPHSNNDSTPIVQVGGSVGGGARTSTSAGGSFNYEDVRGMSFDEVRKRGPLPDGVRDAKDYQGFVAEMEARLKESNNNRK